MQYVISGGVCIYIYIYIFASVAPGPGGAPVNSAVRGSIRLIERPACARSRLQTLAGPTWCTLDSSKVSAVCEDS